MLKLRLTLFFILIHAVVVFAQPLVRISGTIFNTKNMGLPQVTVMVVDQAQSTVADEFGRFTIYSKTKKFSIKFTRLGYQSLVYEISANAGARLERDVVLYENLNELEQINITDKQNQLSNSSTLNIGSIPFIPSVSGNFENIIKTLPGVSVNNELSSQYSVRGGNFNENLVYINDIEINRPYLVRNGQQEGLGVINSDFVSKATFSAGGFEAKFGDKLSSVLDVKYDYPDSNLITLNTSLLNSSLSLKKNFNKGFLLLGMRYKNNASILKTQQDKGNYQTNFSDTQLMYQYNFSPKFNVNIFSNINFGNFKLLPRNRETEFGTLNTTMKLDVEYTGEEIDKYKNGGLALTTTYIPKPNVVVKFINSYFKTVEKEYYDIEGRYLLRQIDNTPITQNNVKGIGSYFNYADNKIDAQNFVSEIKVDQNYNSHVFSWGVKFERAKHLDALNEYDYTHYYDNSNADLENVVLANNSIELKNYSAYLQDSYSISSRSDLQLGARATYSSLSKQFLVSPRLLLAFRPVSNNKIIRFSAGVYQQAPSYRTLLDVNGTLNINQKAQRSYNTSFGYDYAFDAFGTRLKLYSEAYFKYSDRLIPYKIDNLIIRYLSDEVARGFTYGTDISIGGEFVKDLVSYFRLSIMKANENIIGDSYTLINKDGSSSTVRPGFLKRPTDQRVNFSFFFQDKLLNSPTFKVHINALYGSRLPIGPKNFPKYLDNFYIPAYKRVDIGFSKDFLDDNALFKPKFLDKNFSSFTVFVELFNLLNIDNTISYLWLKDVNNVQYAIPNYLTQRQLNLKLIVKFKAK